MKIWLSVLGILLLLFVTAVDASEEAENVKMTIQKYIDGTSISSQAKLNDAFYKGADLFLTRKDKTNWIVPAAEYISWFDVDGKDNGRIGNLLSLDIENDIATAKVEIIFPSSKTRYIDMFLLKKLDGSWKIISKTATSTMDKKSEKRILFIVSSAHFHGDSELPAGVSFSEIIVAYDKFISAGYSVDFVSPKGGAIPLSYINTSLPEHKAYLYDPDFMYAISHTQSPEQIEPSLYSAVQYIGGSNAMYGVANNKAIQRIAMAVYEQHKGVISSVCHGTAGIAFLKTQSGEYLVKGRRITGYPDNFENQSKAYFQEFPFLIKATIENHGGKFSHAARNKAHVEVDGRIVTGQNHLSSAEVAKHIIEIIEAESAE
jgi:putative intracellular protease/amidase